MAEASHACILFVDKKEGLLRGAATSIAGFREQFRQVRIPLSTSKIAAAAVRSKVPVAVSAESAQGLHLEMGNVLKLKSALAIPLLVRDEAIGTVLLGDSERHRDWTDAQIERATVVARQVAVAAANARLYDDLKHSYDELAKAQEELVKRERLAALGELAAVVAHEVRNPLGVIFNSLRSLQRVLKPQGDAALLLDIVGEEADRLNRIVGDLLDFSRPSEPSLQPEPLLSILSSVVGAASAAAASNGVRMEVEANEPFPKAQIDVRLLRQALLNLVINAIQAMPKGGRVALRAHEENQGDQAFARIEVEDTGPGIPPSIAERVFQPFFTTKAAGTGLGLAVVRRIVEAHHGSVMLESASGEGARFVIRLPLEPKR
jgi:two-component system, NtrC family, sensor histidine kinase HydH